jgi:hypothetical protein
VTLSSLGDVLNKETPAFPWGLPNLRTPSDYAPVLNLLGMQFFLAGNRSVGGYANVWVVGDEESVRVRLKVEVKLERVRLGEDFEDAQIDCDSFRASEGKCQALFDVISWTVRSRRCDCCNNGLCRRSGGFRSGPKEKSEVIYRSS